MSIFCMSLLSEQMWLRNSMVDILLEVFHLVWYRPITMGSEFDYVGVLVDIGKSELLVDVLRKWLGELREANVVVLVIWASDHDQVLLNDTFS